MDTVSFEEFKKLSIKICRIIEVKDHPNADKLYILRIDIGGEEREVVAGTTGASYLTLGPCGFWAGPMPSGRLTEDASVSRARGNMCRIE